jgi:hypothetical protein
MRHILLLTTALLLGAAPAFAASSWQASNIDPYDTHSDIAPNLPLPMQGVNAGPQGYLHAAEQALHHGRTGLAQNALEMAETRLLDRAVPRGQGDVPDRGRSIHAIDIALRDLARNDIVGAERATHGALTDTRQAMNMPGAWNVSGWSSHV